MILLERALPGNQFVICLLNFFEARFGQFLKIIAQMLDLVWMIFGCETAVGGFDFFLGGARGDTQDCVGILAVWVVEIGGAVLPVIGLASGFFGALFRPSQLCHTAVIAPERIQHDQIIEPPPPDQKIWDQIAWEKNIKQCADKEPIEFRHIHTLFRWFGNSPAHEGRRAKSVILDGIRSPICDNSRITLISFQVKLLFPYHRAVT